MIITNLEKIKNKIECSYIVGKYLIYMGVPLLGIRKNKFYFADTELFRKTIDSAPFIIRIFYKAMK